MLEQKPLYKNTWKVRYIGDGKITKVCKYCGKEFKTTRSAQIYCDSVCSLEGKNLDKTLFHNYCYKYYLPARVDISYDSDFISILSKLLKED